MCSWAVDCDEMLALKRKSILRRTKLKTLTLCDIPISTRGKSSSCPKKNLQTRRHMISEKQWLLPRIEGISDRVAGLGQKPSFSLSAI